MYVSAICTQPAAISPGDEEPAADGDTGGAVAAAGAPVRWACWSALRVLGSMSAPNCWPALLGDSST